MKFFRYLKDVMRFNQLSGDENQLCFYCEGKNYWPHLSAIVDELLENSDVTINYVTSEDQDPALNINHKNFKTYVIGDGFIRNYFFDNLKSDVVVMTMPDLDQYQIKKSKNVRNFIYIHHSLVSHHMVYRPKAFDAFDVIFCAGPHHNEEIHAMEDNWSMPKKKLVNHGYGRLDSIMKNNQKRSENGVKKILVAPSWGENGAIELMGEELIDELMKLPYEVILRPHPQTLKFAKPIIDRINEKYQTHANYRLEVGVASETSLHESDVMISDWSGAALDYAFGLLKPVLFLDVPKKIQNPSYEQLPIKPFESKIRNQIGMIQSTDLSDLNENLKTLLESDESWQSKLSDLRAANVHNVGNSGKVAAQAILDLI